MFADQKPVAAIVTEYRQNTHADVIVGRILEGYNFDGKQRPQLKLVSLYTDQVPDNDWSRPLSKKHHVPIFDSIEHAILRGSTTVQVEGVLCIGENGNYPTNEKGQHLSPRRRFFEEVAATFEKSGRGVPVFIDKQLAHNWADAKATYDRSRELMIPLMAGSSLPVTWRQPRLRIPMGCRMREALAVGYGPIESSGFHALEMLACMVERRRDGESGVYRVQCLEGRGVWDRIPRSIYFDRLLDAALGCCPGVKPGSPEQNCGDAVASFLIDYCDGLHATVLMLNGHTEQFGFAARLSGLNRGTGIHSNIAACNFYLQATRPFGHFTYLVQAIERMVLSGHSAYPVERTLLTTGVLDALMTSRHQGQVPLHTPYLVFRYDPVDYPFAPDPLPA